MKTFVAPNERMLYIPEGRIVAYGLSSEESKWIKCDTKKLGWQLQYGISILFGDHSNPNDIAPEDKP